MFILLYVHRRFLAVELEISYLYIQNALKALFRG